MLYYILYLFPLTISGFFFQSSPCSCPQTSCPLTTVCPEPTLPTTFINPSPVTSFQVPFNSPPCQKINENNGYDNSLSTYQEPILITSSYSPIQTYGYQEIPQSQQIYIQPSHVKENNIETYQSYPNYNIQDMIATSDNYLNNNILPQRDSFGKEKFFADKTSTDKIDKKKKMNNKKKSSFKSLCNDSKLAKIMAEAIVSDITISKLLISDAVSIAYDNNKANVICASGDFSYSILIQNEYCETTKGKVTCFVYL
ncbi:Ground-like domain-containing protein [Strongyloides ratti]|uniref:Ground-like domain-containing protein n=1 Tax=Strongyloides ratti TaxID=34506 RepID=A0A090KZE1_STRRB|nr:Ground-like domain-containing protein [Strongyloides ratti]CEF61202.1 Ground-like domain-containing protein [Strongyloides ratti]